MAWIRRVRTASGATAVQIAEYDGGRRKIGAHMGSARTEAEQDPQLGLGAGEISGLEECLKPVDLPGRGCTFPDHP